MPHPLSPHRLDSEESRASLGTAQDLVDEFCVPFPHDQQRSQPSSSPMPSIETPFLTTSIEDSKPNIDVGESSVTMRMFESDWNPMSHMSGHHTDHTSADYHLAHSFMPSSEDFYHHPQNFMSFNDNYDQPYHAQNPGSTYPQSYYGLGISGLPCDSLAPASYPPAVYQLEPQQVSDTMDLTDQEIDHQLSQLNNDDDLPFHNSQYRHEEHNMFPSPYLDMTQRTTPLQDNPQFVQERHASEDNVIDKDQPYAQLIYQALLGAPGYTMVLRDIYDWFQKHTDKAHGSETKGWQNSIRHNLSMNGAFEKVDQPCEDARKGFMWRLTEDALRDGVRSTTRYRSKQPNKRGTRNPQPQTPSSRNPQAVRRALRSRRSTRAPDACRSDPYAARLDPPMFHPTDPHAPTYQSSPYYARDMDLPYGPRPSSEFGGSGSASASASGSGSSLSSPSMDLFPSTQRSYASSPMSQGLPIMDTTYMLDPPQEGQGPGESLFSHSPSPATDEPRTPVEQGGWGEDVGVEMGGMALEGMEESGFRKYAG